MTSAIAGAIQGFLKVPVARVEKKSFGGEAFGKIRRQIGFEETLGFLHDAFGDGVRHEECIAFEGGGEGDAPGAEITAAVGCSGGL